MQRLHLPLPLGQLRHRPQLGYSARGFAAPGHRCGEEGPQRPRLRGGLLVITQLFSGTLFPFFFLVAAPQKMVFPKKGSLFFRVTEQLRSGEFPSGFCWDLLGSAVPASSAVVLSVAQRVGLQESEPWSQWEGGLFN